MGKYATLHLVSEVTIGGDVHLNISDEDLTFVHELRKAAHKQTGMVLPMYRAIQARYALLHSLPLHVFRIEFDDHSNETHIVEERTLVDNKKQIITTARVNNEMRKSYNQHTKKAILPGPAGDEIIAKWWINESKNAILDAATGGKNPQPGIKVLRRGSNSIDYAFKMRGAKYQWGEVRNVPVDMKQFRKQAKDQGFIEDNHAGYMIRQSKPTWNNLLEKDGPALEKDNVSGLNFPRRGKSTGFKPGYNIAWEKYNGKTIARFHDEPEFRRKIEIAIAKNIGKWMGIVVKIPQDDEDLGNDENYNFNIPDNEYHNKHVTKDNLLVLFNAARQYVLATSGHGNLDDDKFLYLQAANGVRNNIKKIFPPSFVSQDQSTKPEETPEPMPQQPISTQVAPKVFKQGAGGNEMTPLSFQKYVNKRDRRTEFTS